MSAPTTTQATSPVTRVAHSVEHAAERLDCGRTTIFALIRDKRLHAVKLNGRTLVPEDSLRALIASLPAA